MSGRARPGQVEAPAEANRKHREGKIMSEELWRSVLQFADRCECPSGVRGIVFALCALPCSRASAHDFLDASTVRESTLTTFVVTTTVHNTPSSILILKTVSREEK